MNKRLATVTEENLSTVGDMAGYKHDFLAINGFDIAGVDYEKDVADMSKID